MMDLDWNESALVSQFAEGLSEAVLDTLALFQTPDDLEGYINAAMLIDARLTWRKEDKASRKRGIQPYVQPTSSQIEPMQVDSVQRVVSPTESERRMKLGLCYYCGGEGHQVTTCPEKLKKTKQGNHRVQA
ncbi:Retrotransposon-derived protein PEG10, partial [Zancudomyces culisetae]